MQNISKIADRLRSFSKPTRNGDYGIQHQTVFIRTAALGDDDLVDNSYNSFSESRLLEMIRSPSFGDLIDVVSDCYEHNVANVDEQFFPIQNFLPKLDAFRSTQKWRIPHITEVRLEIRPAQIFSQNVYYFAKENADLPEIESQFRTMMADYGIPAETVNLSFNATESITLNEMYEIMTVLSILLRESAKDAMFIPGRVIGVFNQITQGK